MQILLSTLHASLSRYTSEKPYTSAYAAEARGNVYSELNGDLRQLYDLEPTKKQEVIDAWRPLVCPLLSGLKKLPCFKSVKGSFVFRGLKEPIGEALSKQYRQGYK